MATLWKQGKTYIYAFLLLSALDGRWNRFLGGLFDTISNNILETSQQVEYNGANKITLQI